MYYWNTVGAIVGSLAAGFVLIPLLRYEGAIRAAVYASAALGIAAAWLLLPIRTVKQRLLGAVATAAVVTGCVVFQPQPPMKLLVTSPLNVGTQARVLQEFRGHTGSIWAVALAPDGKHALSAGDDREIRVWRLPEK